MHCQNCEDTLRVALRWNRPREFHSFRAFCLHLSLFRVCLRHGQEVIETQELRECHGKLHLILSIRVNFSRIVPIEIKDAHIQSRKFFGGFRKIFLDKKIVGVILLR